MYYGRLRGTNTRPARRYGNNELHNDVASRAFIARRNSVTSSRARIFARARTRAVIINSPLNAERGCTVT